MHQARIERMQEAREKRALKARGGGEPEPDKAGEDGMIYKRQGAQAEGRRREAGRGYGRGAASETATPTPSDVRRARDPLMDSGGASLFSGYSGAGRGTKRDNTSKIAASLR